MKKFLVVLLLLIITTPLWAAFCHVCGNKLPDKANFCPACGKAVASAFETAPTMPAPAEPAAVVPAATTAVPVPAVESALENYEFINQMEMLLTDTSALSAAQQFTRMKSSNSVKILAMQGDQQSFNSYRSRMNKLHLAKMQAVEAFIEAWKRSQTGPDQIQAMAEKDRQLFILGKTNEAIDRLITGGNSLVNLADVEKMEARTRKTTQLFKITSAYLLINNQRLNRGEPLWIIDVSGANAQVLHMGHSGYPTPVTGWVSIYDLEKRSNWRSDPDFFYSSAPPVNYNFEKPETQVKVVIYERKPYHYRHYPWGKRNPHKKRHPHRHYDYVIVEPKFW
ncbi:MAG: zinc ribbon domain-containing protein [Candidatus Riflebacteria bacterium]